MLRIGQFAKISGLSIKTLRYYDETELLNPIHIDQETGYRYYSEEQLLTAKRILAFKEQGFTLNQIKQFLHYSSLQDNYKKLLDQKISLEHTILEAQRQLSEVSIRLQHIEQEHANVRRDSISIRKTSPELTASIRDIIPRSQLCLMLDEVMAYMQAHTSSDVLDQRNTFTIIWHDDQRDGTNVDVEVCIPISSNLPETERVKMRYLPEMTAASLLHYCDPYANGCTKLQQLRTWIASQHGLTTADEPYREIYLTSDRDMYGNLRLSELLIPVIESTSP